MPKSIIVEPEKVCARDIICFSDIPMNAYNRPFEEEVAESEIRILGAEHTDADGRCHPLLHAADQ